MNDLTSEGFGFSARPLVKANSPLEKAPLAFNEAVAEAGVFDRSGVWRGKHAEDLLVWVCLGASNHVVYVLCSSRKSQENWREQNW